MPQPRAARGGDAAAFGPSAVRRAAREVLVEEPLALVDYLVLVHPHTLADVPECTAARPCSPSPPGSARPASSTTRPLLVGPGGGALDVFSDVPHARADV